MFFIIACAILNLMNQTDEVEYFPLKVPANNIRKLLVSAKPVPSYSAMKSWQQGICNHSQFFNLQRIGWNDQEINVNINDQNTSAPLYGSTGLYIFILCNWRLELKLKSSRHCFQSWQSSSVFGVDVIVCRKNFKVKNQTMDCYWIENYGRK